MSNKKFTILISALLLMSTLLVLLFFRAPFLKKNTPQQKEIITERLKNCNDDICPSQIIDLSSWKLTLPVTKSEKASSPQEIIQPQLASFELSPWFTQTPDKKGVSFRAPVNATTTSNTDYPRSELREMASGGKKNAFWPSKTGSHMLFLDQAITAVPQKKPDVVAGQIHGDDDDLIVIRLEYPKLFIARGKSNLYTLDENYELGRRFTIKFIAQDGQIKTYYNGNPDPVYVLDKKVSMAYFKVGVYTQSNCETEELPELCNEDNYGEVVVYDLKLSHQ